MLLSPFFSCLEQELNTESTFSFVVRVIKTIHLKFKEMAIRSQKVVYFIIPRVCRAGCMNNVCCMRRLGPHTWRDKTAVL